VINALQALEGRPSATIDVRIWADETSACLSVADNGIGISDEIIGRIFDPFFTTKGPDRGTGLGLSICRSIMHLLDGDITVTSQPDVGSVFTLTLPLGKTTSQELRQPSTPSKSPFKSCALAQILAVDDEDVVRNVLQEMLHSCFNCSVDLAHNGAEALEAISHKNYDLIVSDIRMPVMDGSELYTRLKDMNHDAAKRFVFMTGHAGDKDLEREIFEWGVPVIAKPFRLSRLSEVCYPFLVNALPPRQTDLSYPP
jgi:CheY-like chemotaxis protein